MPSIINSSTSAGLITTGSTDGSLALQTNGTTAVTIDTSGNMGIGTSSPTGKFQVVGSGGNVYLDNNGFVNSTQALDDATAGGRFVGYSNQGKLGEIAVEQTTIGAKGGYIRLATCASGSNTATERMRITSSGDVLIGTTSILSAGKLSVSFDGSTRQGATFRTTIGTTGSTYLQFENSAGGTAGYIIHNGTTTVSYVTSSDYRLKEAITPMTGALAKVAQLKPVTYKWKVDGSNGEGFIAHELAEVCPIAVTREKDAVDADGNPVYQGIDTSFLVATLTAAIQEQQALIQQLQADVAVLKGTQP